MIDQPKYRLQGHMWTRWNGALIDLPAPGTTEEAAAMGLLSLMAALSEEVFAAGWLESLEYQLWLYREHGPGGPDDDPVTDRHCRLLRLLSEECNGWWMHSLGKQDGSPLQFVSLDEWRNHIQHFWMHRGGFIERR